jgi:ABC-type transport system involved in multi-copper enzyme maturation permease subunit
MNRLFQIEWIKLRNYRAFKVLVILYFLAVALTCSSGMFILEFLKDKGLHTQGIDPTILPIYDFPDIWHNLSEAATWMKIILAFIILISITNEITYKTLRQNIIDGLSRKDFILSKIAAIIGFSLVNTLLVFILGLVLGCIYSHQVNMALIFSGMEFIGGFFLSTLVYLLFAFVIGIIVQRTGIAIVFLMIYSAFIEPIVTAIFAHAPLPSFFKSIVPFFPVEAVNNVIRSPFTKYGFQEIQDYIAFNDVLIVVIQATVYIALLSFLLKRKDL